MIDWGTLVIKDNTVSCGQLMFVDAIIASAQLKGLKDSTGWYDLLKDYMFKNLKRHSTKPFKFISEKIVKNLSQIFWETIIDDVINNKVVFKFPRRNIFLFCAQAPGYSKSKMVYFENGMRKVNLYIVISKREHNKSLGRLKVLSLIRSERWRIVKRIKEGDRYPRFEDIVYDLMPYLDDTKKVYKFNSYFLLNRVLKYLKND